MVQLSINQVTSKQWSLEEDAFFYNHYHFHGVGLWRFKATDFGDEKTRALLDDSGLQASSLSFAGGFTGCEGRWIDSVRDAKQALNSAHTLGANSLILYTGSRNRHIPSHAKRCVTQAIDSLLPIAQEFGIRLLLQPMLECISRRWNFVHDWESLFQIIDRYPAESVGFVLNTYHATFLNEIWAMLPERVAQLGLVQLSDSLDLPKGSRHRDDCLLGQGRLMPDHRLKQIVELGYRGWVEVEILGPTWGREGYRHVLEASHQFATELLSSLTPNGSPSSVKQDVV